MNEQIIPVDPIPEADDELVALVDGLLEGQLNTRDKALLEQRLSGEENAQAYCADRLRFHAELQELMQPLRVEMEQRRHIVLERKHGLPHITTRESQVARIGNPKTDDFIEIPPDMLEVHTFRRRAIIAGFCLAAIVCAFVALLIWQEKNKPEVIPPSPVALELRNPGFEDSNLSAEEAALSFILLDWQDHFFSENAGVCELSRYSKGRIKAHSGQNVALMKPRGFLTQRLKYSDGSPLKAQPGLRVRVHGWALVQDANWRIPLRFALRVVQDIKPDMRQYEPHHSSAEISGGEWREFQVDLIVPSGSLILKPSDTQNQTLRDQTLDITGKELSLSIDNRKNPVEVFLDDLSIEIVDTSQ